MLDNNICGVLYKQNTNEIIAECNNITIEKEYEIKNQQLIRCYDIYGLVSIKPKIQINLR